MDKRAASEDPLLPELKRVKEELEILHVPPRPQLDDKAQLVKDLEDHLKIYIATKQVPLLTHCNNFMVPSIMFSNSWWDRVREWALNIANKVDVAYVPLFKGELNDCLVDVEEAWYEAHPLIHMQIDADAYYPEKGSLCAEFKWEE